MSKYLTPREIWEQAAHETEVAEVEKASEAPKKVKLRETAADRRNFFRKKAGWPPLRTK